MLTTGDKAPDFTLLNTAGKEITLSNYTGNQNIVLLFFPLAFSDVCTDEMCHTRDNMKLYHSQNAAIFGISVDSFFTLREFKKAQNLNFELLSDFNKEVSIKYGVLYKNYFGMRGVAKRSVFIIDESGVIRHKEILEDSSNLPDFDKMYSSLMG